jgi:Oxidoreductase family, NAD-binding Rossmann fold
MRDLVSGKPALIPVGIVGAGRTRAGLGPFLAAFLEQEGFFVAGVSGRSLERAAANAETIGQQLGHEVKPFPSPTALCASGVTALVIASPPEFHIEALQAAAEAGLPALCEKPLVHQNHSKEGAEVIEDFARKRLPLLENCQWPYVLPAFVQLHGAIENGEHRRVEMGLGPPRPGQEMVQNTVSHLLSVVQAVFNSSAVVSDVSLADPSYKETRNLLRFRLVGRNKTVDGLLHLEICATVPRPAWLAINGCRMDRRVGQGYSIVFAANGVAVAIADPTRELVKHFALLVRNQDPALIDQDRDRIRQRLEWYRLILDKLK